MEPIQNSLEDQALPLTSAAAYVRMSTEHQQYSTSNQMDVIRIMPNVVECRSPKTILTRARVG